MTVGTGAYAGIGVEATRALGDAAAELLEPSSARLMGASTTLQSAKELLRYARNGF
jgi:hypothetical protein